VGRVLLNVDMLPRAALWEGHWSDSKAIYSAQELLSKLEISSKQTCSSEAQSPWDLGIWFEKFQPCVRFLLLQGKRDALLLGDSILALLGQNLIVEAIKL